MSEIAIVIPIINPPAREASVPTRDMPPLVPGGTGFKVVMRIGGDVDRMPSSDASVSPRQHAKCLEQGVSAPSRLGLEFGRGPRRL